MTEDSLVTKIKKLTEQFQQELKTKTSSANQLLKDKRFKHLFNQLQHHSTHEKANLGLKLNQLRNFLLEHKELEAGQPSSVKLSQFDLTAPFAGQGRSSLNLVDTTSGSIHPINSAIDDILAIFSRMGFEAVESRQLDSQYYMFDSLNFPATHPAREEFDTFLLDQVDRQGRPLVAPAHTSTMQNRIIKDRLSNLEANQPIAVVVPGRVFRHEDVDASHDHMFYQLEGLYVDSKVTVGHLLATLKEFIESYYQRSIKFKIQPFYFPFTEPSFEVAIWCPFCHLDDNTTKDKCSVCSQGWIELLGCGSIHPNVLKMAGVDPNHKTGFAFGIGLMRLVMIKHNIEDIRHFTAGRLDFLRQFKN